MGLLDKLRGAPSEPHARVRMVVSYAPEGFDFVAGEQYDVPVSLADRMVARGYAEGELSREHSDEELAGLRGNAQVVRLG